jgi:hypothetical protein
MTTRRSIALILSPVGLLLISAGRLIIVANFNTTTAVTIASSGGFVNTLLGTVIPMVPVFIPYLALLLLLSRRFLLSIMTFAFAAFISPTSITLIQGLSLAKADWHHLVARVTDYRTILIVIALLVFVAAWAYNRSFAEGLSIIAATVVAAALLFALPVVGPLGPLRLASNNERRLVSRASAVVHGFSVGDLIVALLISVLIYAALVQGGKFRDTLGNFTGLVIAAIALAATIALFPYVHYIYPVPQDRNYYAEATHAMWLPAERIALNSHRIYYGYVLSSDTAWFTVLLTKSRTITYIPAGNIVERSVCQPGAPGQPKQYPPLIPWLYHRPSRLPVCKSRDVTVLSQSPSRSRQPREPRVQKKSPPLDRRNAGDASEEPGE